MRHGLFDCFVSCLVLVPREKLNTDLCMRIQGLLQAAYRDTAMEFASQLLESMLARIYITTRTQSGNVPEVDVVELKDRIMQITRRW